MTEQEIEALLKAQFAAQHIQVNGDGSHFVATIVCDCFENLSTVKRQQRVYAVLNEAITSGTIHALSLKTYTPSEWQASQDK